MTKVKGRTVNPAYEIHLGLYQALTGPEEHQKPYKQGDPDFFDLIVVESLMPMKTAHGARFLSISVQRLK